MSSNFLMITLRSMKKQKLFSSINIIGLALGFTCCFLIVIFILTELSYDRHHKNADNIYRVVSKLTLGKTPNMIATTNSPAAMNIRDEYAGVIEAARLRTFTRSSVKNEESQKEFYEENIYFTDPTFFKLFDHPPITGDPINGLARPNTIVITKNIALKYFEDLEVLGKLLQLNGEQHYEIVAVVDDIPSNSHYDFDILISYSSLYATQGKDYIESWDTPFGFFSYLLLDPKQDPKQLELQLPQLVDKNIKASWKNSGVAIEFFLQPLTDIHLHSNFRHEIGVHGDIQTVYIFGSIAAIVLIIACFNFVNLSTARSTTKAKEIGIRKILGSNRRRLIFRFLSESISYSVLALFIAVMITVSLLPAFSQISERSLSIRFEHYTWFIPGTLALTILIGLICGIYPALFLSSFPAHHLQKQTHGSLASGAWFRKLLVLLQFTISIGLMICTKLVGDQLNFIKNRDLGFNKEQVLVIPMMNQKVRESVETIKQELLEHPNISHVSASSHVPGKRSSGGTYQPEGYDDGQTVMLDGMWIDDDLLPTLEIQLVSGRNFSKGFTTDKDNSILINETAAKEIGWDNPLGKEIKFPGEEKGKKVIGVVKDFFFKSPQTKIRGLYISYNTRLYNALFVRVNTQNLDQTIEMITAEWRSIDPNRPLDYYFLNESYDQQYRAEEKLSTLFNYFSGFSLFIACLGLFGMSSFMTEQRIKEIGIRKVLGASVSKILVLLSKSTLFMVTLSIAIAIPMSIYAMNKWLDGFAHRIDLAPWPFMLAGGLGILVAGLTVCLQSLQTALMNPAHTLRNE